MKIEKYAPSAVLQPFVQTFLLIESENGMQNNILPNTSLVLAFRLKGLVTDAADGLHQALPASTISGIRKSPRLLAYARETANLLVVFTATGAAAFFKEPLHALSGISVPLDNLVPPPVVSDVEAQLAEAPDHRQRIATVERFLLSRLKQQQQDWLVLHAIEQIRLANGNIKIKDLAGELYISADPFEKRFRRITGTSPKQFATLVRLNNLVQQHAREKDLTRLAYAAGYFDQAHFIKDFKSFTGKTPGDFFKSPPAW